jgi:ribosome-binding factor A
MWAAWAPRVSSAPHAPRPACGLAQFTTFAKSEAFSFSWLNVANVAASSAQESGFAGLTMPVTCASRLQQLAALPSVGRRLLATSADGKWKTAEQRARRQLRVGSKIQRALADLLASTSALRTANTATEVVVTGVTVSADLKAATAYWLPDPRSRAPAAHLATLLARQAGPLAHRLANEAELRAVPRLRFRLDEARTQTQRVADLIELLARDRAQREGAALPAAPAVDLPP